MTIQETKEFLDRIRSYYPTFIVDTFTTNEWYNQLKEYKTEDINKKFEEHLKSEIYGDYIPKINFLTKGLRKIGETGYDKSKIFVRCNRCGQMYSLDKKEEHDKLCIDIDYMNFLLEKYSGKSVDKIKCFEMPQSEFYAKFKKALEYAISKEQNDEELSRLKEILKVVKIEEV